MSAREGIPRDEILGLAKSYQELKIQVRRQDTKGHWGTCTGNLLVTPVELADIGPWLQQRAGGGRYLIDVENPQNPEQSVIQPFTFQVEGPTKPFEDPATAAVAAARRDDPRWQAAPHTSGTFGPRQAEPSGRPATEILHTEMQDYKAEIARMRAETQAMIDKSEKAVKDAQEEVLRLKNAAIDERAKAADKELAAKSAMSSLTKIDIVGLLTAVGAIVVPITTAIMTNRSESEKARQERDQRDREAQREREARALESQNRILEKLAEGPKGGGVMEQITQLMGVVKPFLEPMLAGQDPEKQARLYKAMGGILATQTTLAGDILKWASENRGEGDPPWLGVIKEIAAGAERLAESVFAGQNQQLPAGGALAGGAGTRVMYPQDQQLPPPARERVVMAPQPAAGPDDDDGETEPAIPESTVDRNDPDAIVTALMQSPNFPGCFKNKGWGEVCYHIATEQERQIEEIAGVMAELMQEFIGAGRIPTHLHPLLKDPSKIDDLFLAYLPVHRANPRYSAMLKSAFVQAMTKGPQAVASAAPAVPVAPAVVGNNGKGPEMVVPPAEARIPGSDDPVNVIS